MPIAIGGQYSFRLATDNTITDVNGFWRLTSGIDTYTFTFSAGGTKQSSEGDAMLRPGGSWQCLAFNNGGFFWVAGNFSTAWPSQGTASETVTITFPGSNPPGNNNYFQIYASLVDTHDSGTSVISGKIQYPPDNLPPIAILTPPSTIISSGGVNYSNLDPTDFTINVIDEVDGSGAATAEIDDNGTAITVNAPFPNTFQITGAGARTLSYYGTDVAGNQGPTQTYSFEIETDIPVITNDFFASGLACYVGDSVPFIFEAEDITSGVYSWNSEVNGVLGIATVIPSAPIVSPDVVTVFGDIDIGISAGNKVISAIVNDVAGNFSSKTFTVTKSSSQHVTFTTLTATRSSDTPFQITGDFEAICTNLTSSTKIAGFFASMNMYYTPVSSDFDTTIGEQYIAAQAFESLSLDDSGSGVMYLITNDTTPCYAAKTFTVSPIDYTTIAVGNPTLSISDSQGRNYTNSLTNTFKADATGGSISGVGSTYPNGDLIVGYMLTESATNPGTPPTYNPTTGNFEDAGGVGWNVFERGISAISEIVPFTSSTGTVGYKTVYLWVATIGHSGLFATQPAQTFSSSTQIYYIDDFQGPTLTNVVVNTEPCPVTSGSAPNQIFSKPSEVTSTSMTVSGTLTDDKTYVERWIVGNYGSAPAYTLTSPGAWNVLSPAAVSTSFNATVTLAAPNSVKTVYVYAVDSVGNVSKNQIRVSLNDPTLVITPIGTTSSGNVYKFEGKSAEHNNRNSIASMFGDGVNHTGFISKRTSDVQVNRIHKLSEYRGLRVQNTITDAFETLPSPTNPLKFSDFLNRKPRLEDLRISPHVGGITTPVNINVPVFEGDIRNLALTVDIDTGDVSTPYITPNNDLVDIDARWFINFTPEGSGSLIPQTPTVSNGLVQNFNCSTKGVYFIVAYDSFGGSVSVTYRIYGTGAPPPPIQDPPIDVDVPISTDPNGTTPITVEFFVNQVCLAVDAALCVDRSGSYVPGFSNAMYNTLSQTLDAIAAFSEDENGNTDARFAMIWYWNPYPGGIEATQNWTTSKNAIISAVDKYRNNGSGGREPKIEVTARAAMGSAGGLIGDWRDTALKMVMLYSDEPDSPQQKGASSSVYCGDSTSANYYTNRLLENKVALVLFDAGVGNASKNGLPDAIARTAHLGSTVQTLGLGASSSDIVNAVNSVFDNYKAQLSFDIEPDITSPAIFRSKVANAVHGGASVPIPYNSLIDAAGTKKAVFDVELDNAEINNVGTNYISTYVTIRNSSDLAIARKEIRIKIV